VKDPYWKSFSVLAVSDKGGNTNRSYGWCVGMIVAVLSIGDLGAPKMLLSTNLNVLVKWGFSSKFGTADRSSAVP
jgi:hypothetical protein